MTKEQLLQQIRELLRETKSPCPSTVIDAAWSLHCRAEDIAELCLSQADEITSLKANLEMARIENVARDETLERISKDCTDELAAKDAEISKLQAENARLREALETPEKMCDADLIFCVNGANQDFSHIPYKDVKEIARRVCRIIISRNKQALSDGKEG